MSTVERADDRPVPNLPPAQQPPPDLRRAYWAAIALADQGWQLRRLAYHGPDRAGVVVAQSRSGLVATTTTGPQARGLPADPGLLELAEAIAELGLVDSSSGSQRVEELCWLVQAHTGTSASRGRPRCTNAIPGIVHQPPPSTRAAAWLAAELVNEYGWHVHSFGLDIAAGGFIADIPGEAMVIFPATIADDGTPAASLARLVGGLSMAELRVLAHLDYQELYAAHSRRAA